MRHGEAMALKVIEGVGFVATGPDGNHLYFVDDEGAHKTVAVSDMVPADARAPWDHIEALVAGFGSDRSRELCVTEFAEARMPRAHRFRITVEAVPLTEEATDALIERARARNVAEEVEQAHDDGTNELRALLAHVEAIFESETLDWETKYDAIFGDAPRIRALVDDLGLRSLHYADPDTDYEEDVRAYVVALREQIVPQLEPAGG
jgi:hypothetical protein